jgi:hypothetical protein
MYLQNYADHTQYHIIYDSYIYMIYLYDHICTWQPRIEKLGCGFEIW